MSVSCPTGGDVVALCVIVCYSFHGSIFFLLALVGIYLHLKRTR